MAKVIVFVNSISADVYGGGERWNTNLARALKQKGYAIYLICRPGARIGSHFSGFADQVYEFEFGFDFSPFSIKKLRSYFKSTHADVVICNFNKDVSIAGKAAKQAGVHKVIFRNGFPLLQKKWKHKLILPWFDTIITNSGRIKDQYSSYQWGLAERTVVIRNGFIKPEHIDVIESNSNKPVILGAGRLTKTKRFDRFIEIIAGINQHIPVKGIIIGEGEEHQNLEKLIADNQLDIDCVGEKKSILPYLKIASLFLHTSDNEGLPNVLIESLYIGVPVVASDAGDTNQLIEHGKNGFIATETNAFIENCITVLTNKEIRDKFIKNGQELMETTYNYDRFLSEFEQLF